MPALNRVRFTLVWLIFLFYIQKSTVLGKRYSLIKLNFCCYVRQILFVARCRINFCAPQKWRVLSDFCLKTARNRGIFSAPCPFKSNKRSHSGDNGDEVPPVPIPNTEVKLVYGESSWHRAPARIANCRISKKRNRNHKLRLRLFL